MKHSRLFALSVCLVAFVGRAEPVPVETTLKLENLNMQIAMNGEAASTGIKFQHSSSARRGARAR